MGWEKDLPPDEKLVACFRPFLEALVCSDLSKKTIQKNVDNMWVLGGEIIRDLNQTPFLTKGGRGETTRRSGRGRRSLALSLRLRRAAEIVRVHVPQVLAVPHSIGSLTPAKDPRIPPTRQKYKNRETGRKLGQQRSSGASRAQE